MSKPLKIKESTHKRLSDIKKKFEKENGAGATITFDAIINNLIDNQKGKVKA